MGFVSQIGIPRWLYDTEKVSIGCFNWFAAPGHVPCTFSQLILINSGSESLGTISTKSESVSSENISSTNEVTIHAVPKLHTSTPNASKNLQQLLGHNVAVRTVLQMSHQNMSHNYSRSSQSTPSPSTTTANITNESTDNMHFDPIVKMEVPDDDDNDTDQNQCGEQRNCGNFNYVGDYIAAELNKLPLRDAFVLKNLLVRQVLNFSEKLVMAAAMEKQ